MILKNVYYRPYLVFTNDGVGEEYEYWFEFDECCLHFANDATFERCECPEQNSKPIPITVSEMEPSAGIPSSFINAKLTKIISDEDVPFYMYFDNGGVIELSVAFNHMPDPDSGMYWAIFFYTWPYIEANSELNDELQVALKDGTLLYPHTI